jgi:hypothetical protein
MFYHKTDFKFSQESIDLITNLFSDRWKENFSHDVEYGSLNALEIVYEELKLYLLNYNLNYDYAGISVFLSNLKEKTKTNPHIDILHKNKNRYPIKSRFNVMILGNPDDPMFWWNKMKFGDPDHVENTFTYFGKPYKSLGIPGDTVEERWQYLGAPTEIKQQLLTTSAFVNTFNAHALELSPGPRLIVSVPFDKHITDLNIK